MRADILVVGQGLAGTLLGWELERAGIDFELVDAGHAEAASAISAGIVNPITGRRLVKSWRSETGLPLAQATYREMESALGRPLWTPMRVRRLFADERERAVAVAKHARGELAPFVPAAPDDAGLWIEAAARVDVPVLLAAARDRWRRSGRLREETCGELASMAGEYALVIDCRGLAGARSGPFQFVPWEFSKGQMLTVQADGLEPDVILNRGHWVLPTFPGEAWVGATHEPGVVDRRPTVAARAQLEAGARGLIAQPLTVTGQRSGMRVNLPDKRPVAGRHPQHSRIGLLNGLGAKGAWWAPALARQWVNHLTEGVPFDPEIAVDRFPS